jgi:hypothetical protein
MNHCQIYSLVIASNYKNITEEGEASAVNRTGSAIKTN